MQIELLKITSYSLKYFQRNTSFGDNNDVLPLKITYEVINITNWFGVEKINFTETKRTIMIKKKIFYFHIITIRKISTSSKRPFNKENEKQ